MKQPELGKKILELRKAKGLTQDELVEKCNISVRTLQRIESGEVTPRSYTTRIIFAALDYNNADAIAPGNLISDGFRKVRNSVSDLFNLKTNTMLKLSLLSLPFLVVTMVLFFQCRTTVAQDKAEVRAHILTLNADFIQTFNARQLDSLGLLYLGNASLIFGNNIPVMRDNLPEVRGREGIKSFYALYHLQELRFLERKSKRMVITDSVVVDIGILRIRSEADKTISGIYFSQWRSQEGKWMIENEMFKFDK